MNRSLSLDELWSSVPATGRSFSLDQVATLPEPARRYLGHAISPGTPLARAVRLKMHGEIKLGRWLPFTAEQVICQDDEMVWNATVRMSGLPITGFDRLIDGVGEMRWKLFGIIPVMAASGPDITRSSIGRVEAESIWLPSELCADNVSWSQQGDSQALAEFAIQNQRTKLTISMDEAGRLKTITMPRWGNPEGHDFHYSDFGGIVEEEGTFGGYTIPTRIRVGWYFGTERFDSEGEFFRVVIDDAQYR